MFGTDVFLALLVLVASVAAGLIAHEYAHAIVLRLAGVECAVEYFPDRGDGVVTTLASCRWARVSPQPIGDESPWVLRLAALMPLALAVPVLVAGIAGSIPVGDRHLLTVATIGWLACAIPSPQDFSVAFYAHRVLEESAD
ncbi:hypothetical protein ACYJ1Y_03335 [Natrialbaceae archaeon A-gly3]